MNDDANATVQNRRSSRYFGLSTAQWRFAIPLALVVIIFTFWPKSGPVANPKIHAQPYIWPYGCEQKDYVESKEISTRCKSENYFIGDGKKFGWPQFGKGRAEYYRVGNDALDIRYCKNSTKCYVRNRVANVYVVGNMSND